MTLLLDADKVGATELAELASLGTMNNSDRSGSYDELLKMRHALSSSNILKRCYVDIGLWTDVEKSFTRRSW